MATEASPIARPDGKEYGYSMRGAGIAILPLGVRETMPTSKLELIHLLAQAESKATKLAEENRQLAEALDQVVQAQHVESMQLAEVSEQLWAAQEALANAEADREKVLSMLSAMSGKLEVVQRQVKETQEAAVKGVSGLEIQARLFEIKSVVEVDPLEEMTRAYNEKLKAKPARG
jgi:hypothetical protein